MKHSIEKSLTHCSLEKFLYVIIARMKFDVDQRDLLRYILQCFVFITFYVHSQHYIFKAL